MADNRRDDDRRSGEWNTQRNQDDFGRHQGYERQGGYGRSSYNQSGAGFQQNYGQGGQGRQDRGDYDRQDYGYGRQDYGRQDQDRQQYGQSQYDDFGRQYGQGQFGQGSGYERGAYGQSGMTYSGGGYGGYGRERDDYARGSDSGYRQGQDYGRDHYGGPYGQTGYGMPSQYGQYGRGQDQDRNWWDRTTDRVQAMFGDEDAQRRRDMDRMGEHRGRGPKGYTRSDDRVREDVNDRLSDDPFVDASDIEVQVQNGEVTLTGHVSDRNDKRRAEDIAERISGVKHVQNNLRVKDRSSAFESTSGESRQSASGGTSTSATTSSRRSTAEN